MIQMFRHFCLLALLVLCGVQLLGTACSNDCLSQWSTTPLHTQDQLPGGTDGQTESDGSQETGELEWALPQQDGLHVTSPTGQCVIGSASCTAKPFLSNWFRPPALL